MWLGVLRLGVGVAAAATGWGWSPDSGSFCTLVSPPLGPGWGAGAARVQARWARPLSAAANLAASPPPAPAVLGPGSASAATCEASTGERGPRLICILRKRQRSGPSAPMWEQTRPPCVGAGRGRPSCPGLRAGFLPAPGRPCSSHSSCERLAPPTSPRPARRAQSASGWVCLSPAGRGPRQPRGCRGAEWGVHLGPGPVWSQLRARLPPAP